MSKTKEIIKYFDLFGLSFSLYINKSREFYTCLGALQSIISLIICVIIFVYLSKDDFARKNPITTLSTIPFNDIKITTYEEEKIWIPWRITDYKNSFVNFTNILYPTITYVYLEKNNSKIIIKKIKKLKYKLCSETKMEINKINFIIEQPLDQLYCIDMDDINITNDLKYDFISQIKLEISLCENGIIYDEKNENCTKIEKLKSKIGDNNEWLFEFFIPKIEFQPKNISFPLNIKYYKHYYALNEEKAKEEELLLQKNILKDDTNMFINNYKNIKNISFWGVNHIYRDFFYLDFSNNSNNSVNKKSRIYSLTINLITEINYYERSFNNFFKIISQFLPITNIVFIFFRLLSKLFKISDVNKNLIELLFENIVEKPFFIKSKKRLDRNKMRSSKSKKSKKEELKKSATKELIKNSFVVENNSFLPLFNSQNKFQIYSAKNNFGQQNFLSNKKGDIKLISLLNENNLNNQRSIVNNNEKQKKKSQGAIETIYKKNGVSKSILTIKKNSNKYRRSSLFNNKKERTIKTKLFPYKYYFFSIFIKSLKIKEKSSVFSKKFINVYNFICQLFDISSYLLLQKQFNILKLSLLDQNKLNIVEDVRKINVNGNTFNNDINESIKEHNFRIFGQYNHTNNIKSNDNLESNQ